MRLEDLDELYAWMFDKRVLHVSAEGITLTLDASALPMPVMVLPEGAHAPEEDEGEQETPQERIRREYAANQSVDAGRDDAS